MKERKIPVPGNVMIIEDEKDLCYLLTAVLKKNNLQPACAYSINEAKRTIQEIKPSIVFLDNRLPDGYGSDFIVPIKEIYPSAKIVMITAHDSAADIDKAFRKGADYFISKPFSAATIKTTLDLLQLDIAKSPVIHLNRRAISP